MIDLTTKYLGFTLKNPIIASASPITNSLDGVKRLEDNGIAAVVLHSLFEEQINHEQRMLNHFLYKENDSYAEALEYFPSDMQFDNLDSEHYLEFVSTVKKSVNIPVIASLNGVSDIGWAKYGLKLQEAGADALELNITYIPTSIDMRGDEVENMYINTVRNLKQHISIPLNVKMNSYFSNPANMAKRLVDAGANGLTLFDNPISVDIDLETLTSIQKANLTISKDKSESLRWCAILFNKLEADLCINTGIKTGEDILKAMMSGASSVALASVLLEKGEKYLGTILFDMEKWMVEHEYESIKQMIGSISLHHTDNPSAYERNSYIKALHNFKI
ncbi:MAG: dihydroorotate dehydrogenase-like protein [Arcobacteraceae bacterium]|nr:dihydroorotate dehydrogenase-like protein [Arcobacteraceae bacterium]